MMSTPPPRPAFADPGAEALPLTIISAEALQEVLDRLPAPQAAWLRATGFEAGLGDARALPGPDGQPVAAVVGQGTSAARERTRFGLAKAAATLPTGPWRLTDDLPPDTAEEMALGWLLHSYRFDRYRPSSRLAPAARLVPPAGVDAARLEVIAEGEFLTRDLINTPASDLGPDELEAAFLTLASRFGAAARVVRGDDLLEQNFPMIHAVGRAATRAPRLLELTWGTQGPALTLVGKGVCFDTGGLDLKPSSNMLLMKKDMGGAATVMGLAQMIMALAIPLRLRVLVPAVENAVAGNAMRPRDILTSRKGLTVEINNTDAEGRLILADALAYAEETPSDLILSMATLTGSARVAVGPDLAPFFTDNDQDAVHLAAAAARVRDPVWRMPFWTPYEPMIEPGIADLDNAPSGSFAGAVTAALFLRRFVQNPRYMHFDIYGHQPSDAPGRPKGGVAQGARAVLEALPAMLNL